VFIAIAVGVVLAYFLVPGVGCGKDGCGDVDPPRAGGAQPSRGGAGITDTGPSPSGTPGPDDPGSSDSPGDGTSTPGGGTGNGAAGGNGTAGGGSPDLGFGVEVNGPRNNGGTTGGGGTGIAAQLAPGPLDVVPSSPGGVRGRLTVDTLGRTARGTLDPFLVRDFRGSRYGWTLTATMSDFAAPNGDRISADRLVWIPRCGPHGNREYPSRVAPGSSSSPGRTALLCSTPASDQVTGGQFDVAADLRMALPDGGRASGAYSATLLLTLA
jgi:hypothetical protein